MEVEAKNVINSTLKDLHKVLLPPFYIKLGLITQFVKAAPPDDNTFKYLCSLFHTLFEAKLKGVSTGPSENC